MNSGDFPEIDSSAFAHLSKREKELLEFACQGLLDKEIERAMSVSANTLRTYWKRIRHKVGSGSRVALTMAFSASSNSSDSNWQYDFETGNVHASDEINEHFALPVGVGNHGSLYEAFYHPADYASVSHEWARIYTSPQDIHSISFRMITGKGIHRHHIHLRVERGPEGLPCRYIGYSYFTPISDGKEFEIITGHWVTELNGTSVNCDVFTAKILGLGGPGSYPLSYFVSALFAEETYLHTNFFNLVRGADGEVKRTTIELESQDRGIIKVNVEAWLNVVVKERNQVMGTVRWVESNSAVVHSTSESGCRTRK